MGFREHAGSEYEPHECNADPAQPVGAEPLVKKRRAHQYDPERLHMEHDR